jgi:uncharacterized protein (DUF433 family)
MPATSLVVHSDPDILGGTPVFVGTRVPFRNLIDYLERNHSLDEFLDSFPTVSREQAVAALEAVSARARSPRRAIATAASAVERVSRGPVRILLDGCLPSTRSLRHREGAACGDSQGLHQEDGVTFPRVNAAVRLRPPGRHVSPRRQSSGRIRGTAIRDRPR